MNENEPRFLIKIHESRAPRPYKDKESLWADEIRRIYHLVHHQVKAVEAHDQRKGRDSDVNRVGHLSIAIFGPSGSGKSSLLHTLQHDVTRPKHGIFKDENLERKVATLPVIDPTTWADSDQFLYAFLAVALEEEGKKHQEQHDGPHRGLSPVQMAFQEVNEYLRVVDDLGQSEEYDPLGLSLQKLERHTSGIRLREKIDHFIKALVDALQAKVVLLPIDDLDMAPDHLVNSLETYQSFLTHARLVPVFTFTDRMAEEIVEVYFDKKLASRTQRISTTSDLRISEKLAVQFLSRCFPVRNRVRLGAAPARVQRAVLGSQETGDSSPELDVFELLVTGSFLLFGHPDDQDTHKVRATLRPSTLRRQIQVIDALADCHLETFRIPQTYKMAHDRSDSDSFYKTLESLASGDDQGTVSQEKLSEIKGKWKVWPSSKYHLSTKTASNENEELAASTGYKTLANKLFKLKNGASWGTVFNAATWSMLNVHRDILRELGLFLEDLYSWHPKELRSYVLDKILQKDHSVQRTLVDRWFNRTDYRRSQTLSLLAANIYRPWMYGEEPYGDDESALRAQHQLETNRGNSPLKPIDQEAEAEDQKKRAKILERRIYFSSGEGLLWFLNVTLGFYLPQIMARNWSDAMASESPVRERMSGNGWDLARAPINAARMADTRQEAFAFGMVFLDPDGYREALEAGVNPNETSGSPRGHLLLRLWTCCGYSRGRYWSVLSFWRILGFIGETIQLGQRHATGDPGEPSIKKENFLKDCERLIRTHCLDGLVPGAFLNRDTDEDNLLSSFPRWQPKSSTIEPAIPRLSNAIYSWLLSCWKDRIFPMPAGDTWIGWKDCFVRRIHGEYILGALWPRLNSAYLEELPRKPDCDLLALAHKRSDTKPEDSNPNLWTADQAALIWQQLLRHYWRSCPPILRLLENCPLFLKEKYPSKDFAIERVPLEKFSWPTRQYHSVKKED